MAKDFWQQVSVSHHVEAEMLSALVPVNPDESTPVLATCWQRSPAGALTFQTLYRQRYGTPTRRAPLPFGMSAEGEKRPGFDPDSTVPTTFSGSLMSGHPCGRVRRPTMRLSLAALDEVHAIDDLAGVGVLSVVEGRTRGLMA